MAFKQDNEIYDAENCINFKKGRISHNRGYEIYNWVWLVLKSIAAKYIAPKNDTAA